MPVERRPISHSQLCELLGVEPARFIDLEHAPCLREGERKGQPNSSGWVMVLEPEDAMQTSQTMPQLNQGGKKIRAGGKKGGGKKC